MRGPTHALGGALTASLFITFNIPHTYPLLVLSAVGGFAALLPDMDNSESTIEHISISGIQPFAIPAWVIGKMFKHRGFMHSLLAVALLSFLLLGFFPQIPKEIVVAILLGYGSHIVLDSLTPDGVPWLYPIEWRITLLPKILCILTGSLMETVFFIGLVVLYVIFLSQANYIQLPQ